MNPPTGGQDYYALLEVERSADAAVIAASYRRLARLKHPDKNRDNPSATADFQNLQEAYSVLKDEQKRLEYDRQFLARTTTSTAPRNRQQPGGGIYAFHVGTDWSHPWNAPQPPRPPPNGATPPVFPQPERKPTWPSTPAPKDPRLEKEIRQARKDIRSTEKVIAGLVKKSSDKEASIAAIWQTIHDLDELLAQAALEKEQLAQTFISQEWLDGLFGSETSTRTAQDTSSTEARSESIAETRDALQKKLETAHAKLDEVMAESRAIAVEIQEASEAKAEKDEKLHELCRRWKINEFGGDQATDDGDWGGWDGWCVWDEHERDDEEQEWAEQNTECWWENYQEPEADAFFEDGAAFEFHPSEGEWAQDSVPVVGEDPCHGMANDYVEGQEDGFVDETHDAYGEYEACEECGECGQDEDNEGYEEYNEYDEQYEAHEEYQEQGEQECEGDGERDPTEELGENYQPPNSKESLLPEDIFTDEFDADLLGIGTEDESQEDATTAASATTTTANGWWPAGDECEEATRRNERWNKEWRM